jgi:TrmH family RNA methyltransferase
LETAREGLAVVLVRPQKASNLGSSARVVKNFGLRRLRVVEPGVAPDEESSRLCSGADDVLASIDRFENLPGAVADIPVVVATSSLRARGRTRSLALAELPAFLAEHAGSRTAFVFGPERSGLTEDEIARASACLRLPTEPDFPTINVSHAVGAVLAVARAFAPVSPERNHSEPPAPSAEIEAALNHWDRALEAIDFYDTGHRDRSLRDWRRIVAGRPLSEREVAILRGVANRMLVALRLENEKEPSERDPSRSLP